MCHWSNFYDGVYEHPDCPSDDIIADNKALDKWVEEQARKYELDRKSAKSGGSIKSASQHQEVIVFDDDDDD